MPTTELHSPLEFAAEVVASYVSAIDKRYGWNGRAGPCLHFTDTGRNRAAATLGYVLGVYESGQKDLGEKLATDFVGQLDRLANYCHGETVVFEDRIYGPQKVPAAVILLGDDGTRHGFGVLWHRLVTAEQATQLTQGRGEHFVFRAGAAPRVPYAPNFNGGLLYHGPGDNSLSVTLTDRGSLWSIHT